MMIPQVMPWLGKEERDAVAKTITDNWITEGPRCKEFSEGLNELFGVKYGVFAPNGTLALYLGLLALGIGPGDQVIVPDTTFIASANAVVLTGADPLFVDVSEKDYQLDISKINLTGRVKAIMPVHLYGSAVDMPKVMKYAKDNNLLVIEDAAQTVGIKLRGQHLGTFGDVGTFSFFGDKTLTTGEGAYVVCKDEKIYKKLRMLRNQGRLDSGTFIHPDFGVNFRITDMQGALGCVQLKKLPEIMSRKSEIVKWYREELIGLSNVDFYTRNYDANYVPFRIVLFADHAHDLMKHLEENGVQSRSLFYPLHKQPVFREYSYDTDFPNSNYAYLNGLCLPVYPTLKRTEVQYICKTIRNFYK